jgi:hypothetical protein
MEFEVRVISEEENRLLESPEIQYDGLLKSGILRALHVLSSSIPWHGRKKRWQK